MLQTIHYADLHYICTRLACYKEMLKIYAELVQKLTDANTPTVVCRHTFLPHCTEAETLISTITALFPALSHSTGGGLNDLWPWLPTCYLQYQHVVDGMESPAATWRLVPLLTNWYAVNPIWQRSTTNQPADCFATPPPKPPAVAYPWILTDVVHAWV